MSSPPHQGDSASPEDDASPINHDFVDFSQVMASAGIEVQPEIVGLPLTDFTNDVHQPQEFIVQHTIDTEANGSPDSVSSNVDVDSVSSFLNVNKADLEAVNTKLLQKIQGTIAELTDIKSEKMTLEVKLENISRVNEKKESLFKKKLANLEKDNTQLIEANTTLHEDKAIFQQRAAELEQAYSSSNTASQASQSNLDKLTSENRHLMDIVSKKNKEVESLRSDYSDLQESNSKLRKTVIELESSTQTSESNLVHATMKIQSLETRLELVSKNNEWVTGELEKVAKEFSEYRKEKSTEVSSLQLELDEKTSDLNTTRLRAEHLSVRFDDVSKKLDDSLIQIKTLKDQKSAEEEEYLKEISVKERLVTLLQRSVDDSKSKIQDLEDRLDLSRSGVANESASIQTTLDTYKEQLERSEAKVKQLEDTIDEFSQSSSIDPNTTVSGLLQLSPSANATAAKHSGLSLSQLYADFTLIKRQLTQERRAKERMQQQMDAFVNELEQKAPIISATKERANMLEKELTALSIIIETTTSEKEKLQKSQNGIIAQLQESQVEITSLRKQKADLARQIQSLLIQVTVRNDSGGPLTPAEKKAIDRIANGDSILNDSDTDRLISDRLVTFQNVIDLQKKNEDLLRIVRELGAKAEQQEQLSRSRLENLESTAISEAKEAIITLQDELKSADTKLNAVTRERDMFRSLLSGTGGNTILSGEISSTSAEAERLSSLSEKYEESQQKLTATYEQFEKLRVESDTTINILNKQINSLTSERSNLSLSLAREKSSGELTTERYNSVQDNLKYARSEIEELRKNGQLLQNNLSKQEMKAHEAVEQLSEAKTLIESLRSESVNLKHEKQIWKSIEERLNKENASLTEEKSNLNTLLMNLQFADKEREVRYSEAQKRWTDHTDSLERELGDVKSRLVETSVELKDALSRKEADVSAYQDRIDTLTAELGALREDAISRKSAVESLELKVQSLTSKLVSTESRLQSYQNIAQSENTDSALVSEALKLKAELDDAKVELEEANNSVSHFKVIATAAEEALESLTQSSDNYRENASKTIESLQLEKKALLEKVDILNHQLESLNNELEEQRLTSKKELVHAQSEVEGLRLQVEESSKLKADYDARVALIESSFQQQVSVASEAQQNYEKELQRHAEASKAYASLREEANAVKEKIQELSLESKQAKDTLVKSQESWDTQKTQLEEELTIATSRVTDLTSQNHILYNQIEVLSKNHTESSAADWNDLEGASDDLRELITLLRREKDISDTRLEVATRDLTTTRQKLTFITSELDKTRSELLKLQSRDSDVDRITQEYKKLQNDLEHLDLLRESNVTLRNELKMSVAKVKVLEQQLNSSQTKVEPLETEVIQLKAELTHKGQELKLSIEEKDRWKQRSQDILMKFDRIDPDEHKKLQEETAELTKKLEESTNSYQRLRDEAQDKLKKSSANYKALLSRFEEASKEKQALSKTVDEAKEHAESLQSEVNTLKAKIAELENSTKKSLKKAQKDNNKEHSAAIDSLKKELEVKNDELKEKVGQLEKAKEFESKVKELEALKTTFEDKITELETQVKTLTDELEDAKKKSNTATPVVDDQSEAILELKAKLDKATTELESAKAVIEKAQTDKATTPASTEDVSVALEEQKKALRAEFDVELKESLDAAREAHKTTIRGATQEKLERIAQDRTKALEEEHAKKVAELKAEFEQKIAEISGDKGSESSSGVVAQYEAKIAAMKKKFEESKQTELAEVKNTAYEEARSATLKEAAMRTKLLQGKIDKLSKQVEDLKKPARASPAVVATTASDNRQSSPVNVTLPERPSLLASSTPTPFPVPDSAPVPVPATPAAATKSESAEAPADHGVKRPAEEENGPQEKKAKADE